MLEKSEKTGASTWRVSPKGGMHVCPKTQTTVRSQWTTGKEVGPGHGAAAVGFRVGVPQQLKQRITV